MANPDWIVTKELDEESGEMIEMYSPRPDSKAEEFCKMIEEIQNRPRSEYKPWVRRTPRAAL